MQFVVCLDTLGQDRSFSEEQRLLALRTVRNYVEKWEGREMANLKNDVMKRFALFAAGKEFVESEGLVNLQAEEDKYVEDTLNAREEPIAEEEARAEEGKKIRLGHMTDTLVDPKWKGELLSLGEYKVVKFPKLL